MIRSRWNLPGERGDRDDGYTEKEAGYPPTLLQYAEVIVWLDEELRQSTGWRSVPAHLKAAFDDAIQREALGRVAKAMQEQGWDEGEPRDG